MKLEVKLTRSFAVVRELGEDGQESRYQATDLLLHWARGCQLGDD